MTENLTELRARVVELMKKSNYVLIACSGPDGDSVGSGCALALVLKKLGKKVDVVAPSVVSEEYKFLPTADEIKDDIKDLNNDLILEFDMPENKVGSLRYEVKDGKLQIILSPGEGKGNIDENKISFKKAEAPYDLIVTVDTGDRHQLGKFHTEYADLFDKITVINIDHHTSNSKFGDINYLDFESASTTEVIYPILEDLQGDEDLIDADIATLLLAGLITDTGSFVHSNTTPRAFKLAATLLSKGARQQEIIKNFFKTKPLAQLKLWGSTLNKLQFDTVYKVAWSSVTQDDLARYGAKGEHAEGIIDDLLTNVPETLVAMLLKEKEKGLISGSFRSTTDDVNVSDMAKMFNGGGHVRAAGFKFKYEGSFEEAEKAILDKVREYMAKGGKVSKGTKKVDDDRIQNLSIEVNGKKYSFTEEDIKDMALKFLLSGSMQKESLELRTENLEKTEEKEEKPIKKKVKAEKQLKEGESVDLKKYYEFGE